MTTALSRDAGGGRAWRALTAVAALYAFVLQAVLGGALPSPLAASLDVLCLSQGDGAGKTSPATPHAPVHGQSCCCTAAHAAAAGTPPLPVVAGIARPHRLAIRLVWRMEGDVAPRAPPRLLARARAPPVV